MYLSLITALCLGQPQAPSEPLGSSVRELRTQHFLISYDTKDECAKSLADQLDEIYDRVVRFATDLALPVKLPESPLQVVLFDRQEDLNIEAARLGLPPGATAGFYDPRTNRSFFGNLDSRPEMRAVHDSIDRLRAELLLPTPLLDVHLCHHRLATQHLLRLLESKRDALVEAFSRLVVRHEVAHQVLYNIGVHVRDAENPAWLVEGLACQFEVPAAGAIPDVNPFRLADLREALRLPPSAKTITFAEYQSAVGRRVVPLVDLIHDGKSLAPNDPYAAFRYAQAWSLVYYLLHERREHFSWYLRHLGRRLPGEAITRERDRAEFENAFGPPLVDLDFVWLNFIVRLEPAPPDTGGR